MTLAHHESLAFALFSRLSAERNRLVQKTPSGQRTVKQRIKAALFPLRDDSLVTENGTSTDD
jgi:hypothetical protein